MARGDKCPRPFRQATPPHPGGRWPWSSLQVRPTPAGARSRLDDGLLTPDETPRRPQPAPRQEGPRVSLVTSLLVAVLLFALGQTAGETAAYLTDSQNVNANAFNAATLFAPTGVAANAAGTTITVSWSAVGFSVDG
jgi:predicted ribosomally synthesized peptide with SipW-like signal peptide